MGEQSVANTRATKESSNLAGCRKINFATETQSHREDEEEIIRNKTTHSLIVIIVLCVSVSLWLKIIFSVRRATARAIRTSRPRR
jgi:hypothetical protein